MYTPRAIKKRRGFNFNFKIFFMNFPESEKGQRVVCIDDKIKAEHAEARIVSILTAIFCGFIGSLIAGSPANE